MEEKKKVRKKILVCWNNCDITILKEFIICLINIGETIELELEFALEKITFDSKVKEENWKSFDSIIILCELTWNEHKFSDFWGIEFIKKEIRTELGINIPILFFSFLNRNTIIEKNKSLSIINTLGLGQFFSRLPHPENEKETNYIKDFLGRKPLSYTEMIDLCFSYCDPFGMIANIKHNIKYQETIDKSKEIVLFLLHQMGEKYNEVSDAIAILKSNQTKEFENICQQIIDIERCFADGFENKQHYQVLLLEDKQSPELDLFLKEASQYNISITYCKTPQESLNELALDISNSYSVIISDYRLEDLDGTLLYPQGYEFLEKCCLFGNVYKYIVFTGLPRTLRHQIAGRLNVEFDVIDDKMHVLSTKENRIELFEKIVKLAEEQKKMISSNFTQNPLFSTLDSFYRSQKGFKHNIEKVDNASKDIIDLFNEVYFKYEMFVIDELKNGSNNFAKFWKTRKKNIFQAKFSVKPVFATEFHRFLLKFYDKSKRLYENYEFKSKELDLKKKQKEYHSKKDQFTRDLLESIKWEKEFLLINKLTNEGKKELIYTLLNSHLIFPKRKKDVVLRKIMAKLPKEDENMINKYVNLTEISDEDIKKFESRLIARRIAIFFYYVVDRNVNLLPKEMFDSITTLSNRIDTLLYNGYWGETQTSNDYRKGLWLSHRNLSGDISRFSDIALTPEEKEFFKRNYPKVYDEWNKS
ncbi:hypothetical protein LJB85_02360 [Porphyromonadaceae bacterium OttesenSCG-928-L07]|nr:hypothetical protein [Porphyromonadaceae bacterium OttesenSCG-928-L07]